MDDFNTYLSESVHLNGDTFVLSPIQGPHRNRFFELIWYPSPLAAPARVEYHVIGLYPYINPEFSFDDLVKMIKSSVLPSSAAQRMAEIKGGPQMVRVQGGPHA